MRESGRTSGGAPKQRSRAGKTGGSRSGRGSPKKPVAKAKAKSGGPAKSETRRVTGAKPKSARPASKAKPAVRKPASAAKVVARPKPAPRDKSGGGQGSLF